VRLDVVPRWRRGELDHLLNAGHSAMKRRLAAGIGAERGWACRRASTSAWVVAADGRTNRARLARHAAVLRTACPTDGRTMAGRLADPREPPAALSFMQILHPPNARQARGARRVERGGVAD
jgi:hypothetical protein